MSEQLDRAVRVLDVLGRSDGDLTVRAIAERSGLPKSSVQRVLVGLVDTELATQHHGTRQYRLGPRTLALGMSYLRRTDLRTMALPHLTWLRDRTGETVGLSIAVGDEMYHVEQVESTSELRRAFALGRPHPLWAGAPSRLLLAGFPDSEVHRIVQQRAGSGVEPLNPPTAEQMIDDVQRARGRGYASAFEETIAGVNTLAAAVGEVPVTEGVPVRATVSVTGPSIRFTQQAMQSCLPDLAEAARRIGAGGLSTAGRVDQAGIRAWSRCGASSYSGRPLAGAD